ncbi:MAG: hypothetical protein RMJ98_05075 [Myxococcales bacterium]|nr:hypothetical protein [Polyangiaceae bacterium]MDW8248661.1 hypothetical protein [Myxococcales bacterium]
MSVLLVGIDENGMGPQLGPLVVTGVLARATVEGARWLRRESLAALPHLDDSKKLVSFQKPWLAEAWARVMFPGARRPDDIVEGASLLPRRELRALCPPHVEAQCWGAGGAFEAPSDLVEAVRCDVEKLQEREVEMWEVRSVYLCTSRLHEERAAGRTLTTSDLRAMERLILALRERGGGPIDAVCGKVGGLNRYLSHLGPLRDFPVAVEEEGRARSSYRFAGVGSVAFVRDADGSDPLVALASLVGKYLREVLMGKIANHHLRLDPSLPRPSGYRDPVTGRFVQATAERRRLMLLPDRCFLRP